MRSLSCALLLLAGSACAQSTPGVVSVTPDAMLPARSADRDVLRALLELDGPVTVTLRDGGRAVELDVTPRFGQAVVQYNPNNGVVEQLDGAWHLFEFEPEGGAESVYLAGSFNGWAQTGLAMHEAEPGVFRALVSATPGHHYYKFVVNGTEWTPDPNADPELAEVGGYGNSGVVFGLDLRELPAPQADAIDGLFVTHDPTHWTGFSRDGDTVRVALFTLPGDVEAVTLVRGDERTLLHEAGTAGGLQRWGGFVDWPDRDTPYAFELTDGTATMVLDDAGDPFAQPVSTGFDTPEWAKSVVWYQVFPERFRNGDAGNDPLVEPDEPWSNRVLPWDAAWFETHAEHGETAGDEHFYAGEGNVWRRRFGGDLQGLIEMLPYIEAQGFTAIYLNPVFEGASMHKYDASDFRHIDDNFGTRGDWPVSGETEDPATWTMTPSDELFFEFVRLAHERGMRVVIDGVFNHVGTAHYAFQDVLEHARDSVYAGWFEITDWGTGGEPGRPGGIQWHAWDGPSGALPALRKDGVLGLTREVRDHIFDITRKWMDPNGDGDPSDGIDGWRLDVPMDVPMPFWRDWRELCKSINPDCYLTGEVWGDASDWVRGDTFDATMNYQFAMAGQDFFVDQATADTATRFADRMYDLAYRYPLPATHVMQNLYGSHDTDRVASMFVNPDRPYDGQNRLQDNGPGYDPRMPNAEETRRQLLAAVWQHTFVGAPMVYYGDEAGMWGPDDPSNRMPMAWPDTHGENDPAVVRGRVTGPVYARLAELRSELIALQRGGLRVLRADDETGVVVFSRSVEGETVIVALNNSDQPRRVAIEGGPWRDRLRGDARVTRGVELPAYGAAVLTR